MMKSLLSYLVLAFVSVVAAISTTGDRLLVVLDDVADKAIYSKFLGDLESQLQLDFPPLANSPWLLTIPTGRGFNIAFETPKSESLSLFRLGERAYDHVIFFPTKSKGWLDNYQWWFQFRLLIALFTGLGPNLTPNILLQFINSKGNILLTLGSETTAPTSIVSLLSELDIHLPADRTGLVVDHFNYDSANAAEKHDVVLLPAPGSIRPDVKNFFGAGAAKDEVIAFPRGVGAALGAGELLSPILRAPRTAYSYNPKEQAEVVDDLFGAGEQLALVSTFQSRNSARFTLVGSAEMLQDTWFDAKVKTVDGKAAQTFNRNFAKQVSGWTFQEIGVLRVNWIEHHLNEVGGSNESNPEIYRIKNDVVSHNPTPPSGTCN